MPAPGGGCTSIPVQDHEPVHRNPTHDRAVADVKVGCRSKTLSRVILLADVAVPAGGRQQHRQQHRRIAAAEDERRRHPWSGSICSLPSYGDPPTAWSPQALSIT
jgi:hypothetical protein